MVTSHRATEPRLHGTTIRGQSRHREPVAPPRPCRRPPSRARATRPRAGSCPSRGSG